MDIIGRNRTLIISYFLSIVGWITTACAQSILIICVGRFICGMSAATIASTGKDFRSFL